MAGWCQGARPASCGCTALQDLLCLGTASQRQGCTLHPTLHHRNQQPAPALAPLGICCRQLSRPRAELRCRAPGWCSPSNLASGSDPAGCGVNVDFRGALAPGPREESAGQKLHTGLLGQAPS